MYLERITSDGISHHSYFVSKGNQAVVIDPRRDIDVYLRRAADQNCEIIKVLETHRNEDYVIGSTALQQHTGAEILHGKQLDFEYGTGAGNGDSFTLGSLKFQALETPGHTPESLTFTLADTEFSDKPIMAFVGDALFVGDTGRTDLWGEDGEAAENLYHSIFETLLTLGDHVLMYPAHGGGSVCGGAIADRNDSTLGFERLFNPKLKQSDKQAFLELKAQESHVQPPYFKRMEQWNRKGNAPIHLIPPVPKPLSLGAFRERRDSGAVVVDLRMPQAFASAHVPESANVWLEGVSAYFGWVAPLDKDVLLVLPQGADVLSLTRRLYRLGYDNVVGYLHGGFESWQNTGCEIASHGAIGTEAVKELLRTENAQILDVRKPSEWESGSVEGSKKLFVGDIPKRSEELDKDATYICMCSVGHRGGVAASLLKRTGFKNVYNYLGGFTAWKKAGLDTTK